jgi:predicted dehydrogenase
MTHTTTSRREFIRGASGGLAAAALGAFGPGSSARSYAQVRGAGDRIRVAIMGVNSRGHALATSFARQENCRVAYICDVDSRAVEKTAAAVATIQDAAPRGVGDVRRCLEDRDLDALVIAAPDHWHVPAALLACKAGKDVYVEKPCSHNPAEGELLVAAARKYGRTVQLGTQRRSWPHVVEAIDALKGGIIGRPYFAKGWYTNNRTSIGTGKEAPVPEWLDYELWQGPAPRRPFRDNVVHYNWHWFWHWGTGEALNNGTHMLDLMRWGLGVEYPVRVASSGGRFHFKDDWETPDTQVITLDYAENVSMMWEGRSCSGRKIDGTGAGTIFHGEKGSLLIDGNSYLVQDLDERVVREVKDPKAIDPRNTVNPAEGLDAVHIRNFLDAIRGTAKLNAEIREGHLSTLLCQLGNIAYRTRRTLNLDRASGHIVGDAEAAQYWGRTYETGWELTV